MPIPITFESIKKKIQRFLSSPNFTIDKIWVPLIKTWLKIYFEPQKMIYVAIDRTNWGYINLFVISVIWAEIQNIQE